MSPGWDTDSGQYIGAASEIEGAGDTTAPTQSTLTFSNVTTTSMDVVASLSTDAGGSDPVEYLFTGVTGSPSGCAYQTSRTCSVSGLTPGTTYGWTVTTRDSVPNAGSASAEFTQATDALSAPVLTSGSSGGGGPLPSDRGLIPN